MGRYDRIARIEPPNRTAAFGGWLTLRDLEGREREPELGRRALLHFLAIRPVRRLLVRGLEGPQPESLDRQIEVLRQEVEQLPPDDAAREHLTQYLREVGGRSPSGLIRATLDVGAAAEGAGHRYAAEEFYRTALELAETHAVDDQRVAALRHLGRVQRERQEWQAAVESLEGSASLAERLGQPAEWARSMEALAAVHLRSGDVEQARTILDRVCDGGHSGHDPMARAVGEAGRCALELTVGHLEAALEAGWAAARALPPADEARNGVLLNMAAAFRSLGLRAAASSCYQIVVRWAAWPEHRIEALLENAMVAADSDDADAFTARRESVLTHLRHADRPLQGMVHLALGRGSLLVGHVDAARSHLQESISMARDIGHEEVLERAERLLTTLDQKERLQTPQPLSPSDGASRIADRLAELSVDPVV